MGHPASITSEISGKIAGSFRVKAYSAGDPPHNIFIFNVDIRIEYPYYMQ
jgi:hypothetical protein